VRELDMVRKLRLLLGLAVSGGIFADPNMESGSRSRLAAGDRLIQAKENRK